MEKDFSKWLYLKIDWAEVLYLYNTGKKYQKKQDLVALFWNSYIYVEFKVKDYFSKFSELPLAELNNLIFEFRQNFPLSDRIKGINYYDDLIYLLIEKYSSPQPIEIQSKQPEPKEIPQTLKECFENEKDYSKVMNILSEKKYIDSVTNQWIYSKKGKQSLVCAFVKDMKTKGYFKNDIKLNWDIAQKVIHSTFGAKIGSNKTYHNAELTPIETGIIPYRNNN